MRRADYPCSQRRRRDRRSALPYPWTGACVGADASLAGALAMGTLGATTVEALLSHCARRCASGYNLPFGERARSGYGDLVAQVLDRTDIAPGETVLDVGCGSGAVARALVNRLSRSNLVVATDINPYILSEARALARNSGLSEAIKFEHANAEALPYAD